MVSSRACLFALMGFGLLASACSNDDSAANPNNGGNGPGSNDGGAGGSSVADSTVEAGTSPDSTVPGSDGSLALAGTAQSPPTGGAAVEAWLAAGWYKQWAAEPAIHASRSPSPHGFNRIYSNQVISSAAGGTSPWPTGAAAVKELYNAPTDTTPVGYAVYLKTQADSAAGANWYWYERVPVTSTAAPHDANGVVADGLGTTGTPLTICVGCHAAAGSDAAHTPTPGGHDEVYTPVSSNDAGASDAAADSSGSGAESGTNDAATVGTSQTPPMGGANVESWLAGGAYKQWHSEPAIHASRSPSPHGFNRIYSNAVINAGAAPDAGMGAWPVGASAVKELYNALTDTTPVGYAVYLKTQADSAAGANWYWYERVPVTSTAAPHDANGVVADGLGTTGTPLTICVGCHAAAGSDAAHTPSPGGRDEVYTPVQ